MQSVHENRIKVSDSEVVLDDFAVDEQKIVDFFNRLEHEDKFNTFQLREQFLKLLQLGFIASQSVDVTNKSDYVEKSFQALKKDMQNQIENNFSDIIKNKVDSIIGEEGTFTNELRETFGADGNYSLIIEKIIAENQKSLDTVFDINNEQSPLNHILKVVESRYDELFGFIKSTEATDKLIKSTTKKGEQFEELLISVLSEACPDFNCEFNDTRNIPGTIGKQGDFVLINKDTKKKIVIEAKNVKESPKTKKIIPLLDECLKNRSADFSIFMYYDDNEVDSMPEPGVFNELANDKLFVMIDNDESNATKDRLIRLACRYSLAKLKTTDTTDNDLRDRFDQIKEGIQVRCKQIKEIKKHSTKISKISNDLLKEMEIDLSLLN